MSGSNVGRWDHVYRDRPPGVTFGYSRSEAFQIGARWLARCPLVADWGCGGGMLRDYIPADRYRGVDGSATWAADVHTDLAEYREPSAGVFMRNVLEHDWRWDDILGNALAAFEWRMVLVIFTPWHTGREPVRQLRWEADYRVPTLQFRRDTITGRLDAAGVRWLCHELEAAPSYYGVEHVFLIDKG